MEKGKIKKITFMSTEIMACSSLWKSELCFPVAVDIEFLQLEGKKQCELKGINMIFDRPGSYSHITSHLASKVYNMKSIKGPVDDGDIFKLPNLPISITYKKDNFPNRLTAVLSQYRSGPK
jgi:hypothetical protein